MSKYDEALELLRGTQTKRKLDEHLHNLNVLKENQKVRDVVHNDRNRCVNCNVITNKTPFCSKTCERDYKTFHKRINETQWLHPSLKEEAILGHQAFIRTNRNKKYRG